MHHHLPILLVPVLLATGCASITGGTNQPLSVETRSKGGTIPGADCKLSNNKGTWYLTTPGSTTVHRSVEDLAVRCEKAGHEPGIASVKSSTKGLAFGNILFGGVVGAALDVGSGAAFDYPSLITVEMGATTRIEPTPGQATQAATTDTTGSASQAAN
jgi:hypothetical protein